MTGDPSISFLDIVLLSTIFDHPYIRNSSNVCRTIVGTDASQLYPFSMCQEMPSGFYTRWEFG